MRRLAASWRECYLATVLTGFTAFCLGPSLVGARTLISVDLLSNFYPWIAQHGDDLPGHNSCGGDTIDSVMPGIAHVRAELWSGHLANWQSLVAGGSQLGAVPDLGLLDPLSLPYFVLPLWLAPAFVVLLEFVVGIGGTFLFLRRLNLSRPASMLAGLIFVTSGFMVMWTNWPQTRVAALIPALFWSVERLIQRSRLTDTVLVALVVSSMLLGGFPEVTGYAVFLATGYLIVRVVILHQGRLRAGLRTIALAGFGAVLGVLLSAAQLLPFLYFYEQNNFNYRVADARQGLPLSGLLTLFAPNTYGLCSFGHPLHGAVNPVELVAYVGSAALVLAVAGAAFGLGRVRREGAGLRGYFVAGAVIIIVLAWVSPTARSLVDHVPPFSGNFIGRIRSVLGFALAVLAAIGFDWLTLDRNPTRQRNHRRGPAIWAVGVWSAVALFGLLVVRDAHRQAFSAGYWSDVERALWIPGLLLIAALAVVALSRLRDHRFQTFAFLVIPLLVAGQAAQFFHTVLPGDSRSDFYPNTPTHQFLESNLGHDRYASSARTMYAATSLYYGLRTPTGHEFAEPAWQALLQAVDPNVMSTSTFSDFTSAINQTDIGSQPILDQMAVKYFVLPPPDIAGTVEALPPTNGTVDGGSGVATCSLAGEPLRGVTFRIAQALTATNQKRGLTLDVMVRSGNETISSGRYMGASVPANSVVSVAVAGESLRSTSGPIVVSIRAVGANGGLILAANDGLVACAPVVPVADGLRLVFADPGSIIYQRLDALPRIRWASRAVVIPVATQRVTALEHGVPDDEVVLDHPGPAGSGAPATVSVLDDSGDTISASVSAEGSGYLVVADAMQQAGWSVTVDGKPASLLPADDAMVAVNVPSGQHRITFRYRAPGQTVGGAVSGIAVLIVIAILGWSRPWRRRSAVPAGNHP
jgi:hypothetical protein